MEKRQKDSSCDFLVNTKLLRWTKPAGLAGNRKAKDNWGLERIAVSAVYSVETFSYSWELNDLLSPNNILRTSVYLTDFLISNLPHPLDSVKRGISAIDLEMTGLCNYCSSSSSLMGYQHHNEALLQEWVFDM